MSDVEILYRKQGESTNCPLDGAEMENKAITLKFIDGSSKQYTIQHCRKCGCKYIWIASKFVDAISNYRIVDMASNQAENNSEDKKISSKAHHTPKQKHLPVLYCLPNESDTCPVDKATLHEITISVKKESKSPLSYAIQKCLKCGRSYVSFEQIDIIPRSDYMISDRYSKKKCTNIIRPQIEFKKERELARQKQLSIMTSGRRTYLPEECSSSPSSKKASMSGKGFSNGYLTEYKIDSALPPSSIMTVEFVAPVLGRDRYTIVKDCTDQNKKDGNYSWNESFARNILKSVFFRIPHYPAIRKVLARQLYEPCMDNLLHFCSVDSPAIITLYKRKLATSSDSIENVTAFLFFANEKEPVPVSVFFNRKNHQYYINESTYREFAQKHGLPYIHIQSDETTQSLGWNLRTHSELNLLGYSVGQNSGVTNEQRHSLLRQLMDSGLMNKSNIMDHLEWLISTRAHNPSMRNACRMWRDDLRFVAQYNMKNQRIVWGKLVYHTPVRR